MSVEDAGILPRCLSCCLGRTARPRAAGRPPSFIPGGGGGVGFISPYRVPPRAWTRAWSSRAKGREYRPPWRGTAAHRNYRLPRRSPGRSCSRPHRRPRRRRGLRFDLQRSKLRPECSRRAPRREMDRPRRRPGQDHENRGTQSPVDDILESKGASHINANVLAASPTRAFAPATIRQHLTDGLHHAVRCA